MTRGKLIVLEGYTTRNAVQTYIVASCEFNGDMYEGGHYEEAIERLTRTNYTGQYYREVLEFDSKNFQYQDEANNYFTFHCETADKMGGHGDTIDFNNDYFGYWFSDYLYFKNLGSLPVQFITRDNEKVILGKGEIAVFNFGHYYSHFNSDGTLFFHTKGEE